MKKRTKTEKLTLASLLLAVGIILPFATSHGIGIPGTVLLPMHIPVFSAALILGPVYGAGIGLALPLLNSALTGMPVLFPMMPIMTAELFTYGLITGILYHKTPMYGKKWGVYASMLCAMAAGRLSYGVMFELLLLVRGHKALSVTAALVTGIPGIVIQLLLIPAIVFTLGNIRMKEKENLIISAKNLIAEEKATLVIIKDGKILATECDRGISPIIKAYDRGILDGSFAVDKIVGKAAAEIMILGGVKYCFGLTMSESALKCFSENGISAEYETLTKGIVNREGNGSCPMEEAVKNIDDPNEALLAIKCKLTELRAANTEKTNANRE